MTKICRKCGQSKLEEEFYMDSKRGSRRSSCKACWKRQPSQDQAYKNANCRKYRRAKAKPKVVPIRKCTYCPTCTAPGNKTSEQCAAWMWRFFFKTKASHEWKKEYHKTINKKYSNSAAIRYRTKYGQDEQFRIAQKERIRAYKNANPNKLAEWGGTRWQRIATQQDGTITKAEVKNILNENDKCIYCGKPLSSENRTIDHIEPVSRGGKHSVLNVVVCCDHCNASKSSMPIDVWMERLSIKAKNRVRKLMQRRERYQLSLF